MTDLAPTDEKVVRLPEPPKPPEWIVGPFEEYRVVIEGRVIPNLTARRLQSGGVTLCVDRRWMAEFANPADAYQAAWLIANAMAVASGYPWLGASNKDMPFAPEAMEVTP